MKRTQRARSVLFAATATVLLLAGCGPTYSKAEIADPINAVMLGIPTVTESVTTTSVTSVGGDTPLSILVRLGVTDTDPAVVAATVDAALEGAWTSSVIDMAGVSVRVFDGAIPERGAVISNEVDLAFLVDELGMDRSRSVNGGFSVDPRALLDRYGPSGREE